MVIALSFTRSAARETRLSGRAQTISNRTKIDMKRGYVMRDSGFVGKPWLTLLCGDMGASSGLDSHRERHSSSTKAYGTVKITIPEQLKADLPQSSFGKLLTATPVVMTVLATRSEERRVEKECRSRWS